MHSVLEGLILRTVCIYSPNLKKWLEIRSRPFSRSLLLSNKNTPLYTYSMQNSLNLFPELKDFGLWLIIWPVERGELLCFDHVDFVSPFLVHYFSNVLANGIIRNRKRTGDMLYFFLNPTLKGMEVSIFPIISLTALFSYFLLFAEQKGGVAPYLSRIAIRSL